MGADLAAHRIPAFAGKLPRALEDVSKWKPGWYCGPLLGYTGPGLASVTYMLPNGRIGHVTSPPHSFRECPDGSLEIRNSILHTEAEHGFDWHGYLNEGNLWSDSPAPPPTSAPTPPPPPTPSDTIDATPPTPLAPPTPSPAPAPPTRYGGDRPVNEAGWPV